VQPQPGVQDRTPGLPFEPVQEGDQNLEKMLGEMQASPQAAPQQGLATPLLPMFQLPPLPRHGLCVPAAAKHAPPPDLAADKIVPTCPCDAAGAAAVLGVCRTRDFVATCGAGRS
jgi:hypothetical protein